MAREKRATVSDREVDQYELITPLLIRMYHDIQELTKKKQDGVMSKTRIAMINRLLDNARELLENEASINFLDRLDDDVVLQNADAMLVVGQYVSALDAFKGRYTEGEAYELHWSLNSGKHREA